LYQAFQEQLLAGGQEQLSRTDPDSRAMKLGTGRGTDVCYNVQTAVDSKHKLILACEVTNDTSDRDWRSPMALQVKAVLERPCEVGAAMGDDHGDEVKACVEAGLTPYVARPITSANKKLGRFSKDDFRYDGATDTYQCPAGGVAYMPLRYGRTGAAHPLLRDVRVQSLYAHVGVHAQPRGAAYHPLGR
jgi:hypothetical protein